MKYAKIIICIAIVIGCIASFTFFPYKEVLKCHQNECSVERYYLIRQNEFYTFNRNDNITPVIHCNNDNYCRRKYVSIENHSDFDCWIFENSFSTVSDYQKIINVIKNNNQNIEITRYKIGYKINENK